MRLVMTVRGVLTGALLVGLAGAARADRAIVVGVNTYPALRDANLGGCVNDAQSVAATLKNYGFEVTTLTNEAATKEGILNAIRAAKSGLPGRAASRNNERFVFYFAGHGTRNPGGGSVLLPSDAKEGDTGSDLGAEEVNREVKSVPARSHTVLLDSCFSGGMMRSFKALGRVGLRTRFYERVGMRGGNSKDLVKVNRRDEPDEANKGTGVCYFTASSGNEQAGEDDFEGTRHGVFTYYLVKRLGGEKERWGDVQATVGGRVAEHMEDLQHPRLTPTFVDRVIFDPSNNPPPNPPNPPGPQRTLWDDFNGDHVDRAKLEVRMEPDRTTMQVNEQLRLSTKVGAPGYLVILERGVKDDVHLLFPESRSVEDAKVEAGRAIEIPEPDKAYAPDAPGTERVRAILFSSRETAEALLKQFPASGMMSRKQLLRDLVKVASKRSPFTTSDLVFEVRPREENK